MADPRDPLTPMSSDYTNPRDPYDRPKSDPLWREQQDTSAVSTWGWIAGGVAVVLVLAFIFGMARDGTDTASNEVNPPVASPAAPPPAATPPATTGQAPATPPSTTGQNAN